jgi:RNA polymerase sigma-70 factor, ECF subfamily
VLNKNLKNNPFMKVSEAIIKSFKDLKKPLDNNMLYEHIIKNNYFEFSGITNPLITISYTLNRLYNKGNGLIGRENKEKGKGNNYFLIVEEEEQQPPIEETQSLEERFEKITGINFEDFYDKYKPKLVWYLTRYTRDQELSEDFADDAFTQALLKIENYDNEKSQIHTWIYKIAENLVKKDFKDQKKMSVVSLDKDNHDNLNLINIIPNGHYEEANIMEQDSILIKKVELVKDAIFSLPDKYKRVMILRELENKPYIDIAEICTKEMNFDINGEEMELPNPDDFSELRIHNKSDISSFVVITYNEGTEKTIELEIKPLETFEISKFDIENVSYLNIISTGEIKVYYKTTTNLSTIKSQISKGRQLIQSMVSKKFKILEDQGLY